VFQAPCPKWGRAAAETAQPMRGAEQIAQPVRRCAANGPVARTICEGGLNLAPQVTDPHRDDPDG
jgi:hypothetical protein